jgi:hypothetical protein
LDLWPNSLCVAADLPTYVASLYLLTTILFPVFSIMAALWTQAEYAARQYMPWILLSRRPQQASNSLLLDYTSPNVLHSLFTSLKRRHWLVSVTISSTLLLRLLIVISTALLVLTNEKIESRQQPLLATDRFVANSSLLDNGIFQGGPANIWASVQHGMAELPAATSPNFAVQSFNVTGAHVKGQ